MKTPSRSIALQLPHYVYVAYVLIFALLVWATGLPGVIFVEASQLSSLSDTISTSAPGIGANHTIEFGTPTGVPADGSTIAINIPTGFDMSFLGEDDIDIEDDGVDLTTGETCGAVQAAVSTTTQTITIEICSGGGGAIAASSIVTIEIGTNATASGSGGVQILNHASEGDYPLTINGTMADSGATRLVILESVTVSGEVSNYFEFNVVGVDEGEAVNADLTNTTGTSTATTVPFGLVDPNTEYLIAQDITVSTNSKDGFAVTVFADGDLQSTGGATIDSFADGGGDATPAIWAQPSALVGSPDTYGHWGLTTEDITLTDDDSFGDALYVGNFVDEAREVMYSTSSADALTDHIGKTRVGYKLEISSLQEAANEYTTRLVYIATPIF